MDFVPNGISSLFFLVYLKYDVAVVVGFNVVKADNAGKVHCATESTHFLSARVQPLDKLLVERRV